MDWLIELFTGTGIGHSIMLLTITIVAGIVLGKIKVANISLGITWILFAGIIISSLGLRVNETLLHFTKELGLILFVYSIGLQVGPGFFASFKMGGLRLNVLATAIVGLSVATAYILHMTTGTDLATMVGILSGAVTNTPGLGAAQQTYTDISGVAQPNIALGYAVAYPLGVIGIILSTIAIRFLFRIKLNEEQSRVLSSTPAQVMEQIAVTIKNQGVVGHTVDQIIAYTGNVMVVSRIKHADGKVSVATSATTLNLGDTLRIITDKPNVETIVMMLGEVVEVGEREWETETNDLVSRRIVITKPDMNGQQLANLNIGTLYEVNITRINRAGIQLVATNDLKLQMGDRVTVVGSKDNIEKVANLLGNSMRRLDQPNLIPIFLGITLGIILGSIPFMFPGIPQPVKLGLAGGPLIVAILMSRYGPYYRMITFTTTSANMMIREIGISLFLAAVGLGAGESFLPTIMQGGYWWILYGFLITVIPLLIVGIFARLRYKLDYFTLMGLLAGSTTDPPALAFANNIANNDIPSVAYATVYPLTMFLRVLTAQILIIFSLS